MSESCAIRATTIGVGVSKSHERVWLKELAFIAQIG
jgi:hypothetical protein